MRKEDLWGKAFCLLISNARCQIAKLTMLRMASEHVRFAIAVNKRHFRLSQSAIILKLIKAHFCASGKNTIFVFPIQV